MAKTASTLDNTLCAAALRLAAAQGWDKITLEAVAKNAKRPLPQIQKTVAGKNDLLPLIVDYITTQSFMASGKPDPKAAPHDRLFEALMARFDSLQNHRKAIRSIAAATRRDPRLAVILAPAQIRGMKRTLAFAGLGITHSCADIVPFALWGIYVAVFRIWQSDETLDMSRTMAALDRALRYAGRIVTLCPARSA